MPPRHDVWANDGYNDGCGSTARTVRLEFAAGARVERVLDGVWFRCTVTDGYVEDDAALYDVEYDDDGNREPDVPDDELRVSQSSAPQGRESMHAPRSVTARLIIATKVLLREEGGRFPGLRARLEPLQAIVEARVRLPTESITVRARRRSRFGDGRARRVLPRPWRRRRHGLCGQRP
ncbi:hypothetical protein M885DRAFT_507417 [Pelagophyceae sp. CCMP2097]|nr:hypothetical protein M885DRAFT_507417 [Pelagophyceae sp. CCMP2097]